MKLKKMHSTGNCHKSVNMLMGQSIQNKLNKQQIIYV